METGEANSWRKCSSCKKSIGYGSRYYVCSVSTCNGQRTGYVFCSVPCWEVHLPGARHKDAAAIEMKSPSAGAAPANMTENRAPTRKIVGAGSVPSVASNSIPREILIVASRLKEYIDARSQMNTSASVMEVLSEHVRRIADEAIDNARREGRKTVLDRDFEFLKR